MTIKELGWPTLLALLLSLACALVGALAPDPLVGLRIWPPPLAAFIALIAAVWTTRRWFLLLLLPFIIWAVLVPVLVVVACFGFGDCP